MKLRDKHFKHGKGASWGYHGLNQATREERKALSQPMRLWQSLVKGGGVPLVTAATPVKGGGEKYGSAAEEGLRAEKSQTWQDAMNARRRWPLRGKVRNAARFHPS